MSNKLLCILILIAIILCSILIYKIEKTPDYNPDVYAQVYEEYNEIIKLEDSISDSSLTGNSIVINKNSTDSYKTIGVINIPKINISYPIINECTDEYLNIAPTRLVGPFPNTIGNLVVIAHNNWNKEFFSNLHKLENDDTVEIIDTSGKKITYKVYSKYEIKQDDFSCLDQETNGRTELTLITCIKHQKSKRLVVKCIAI